MLCAHDLIFFTTDLQTENYLELIFLFIIASFCSLEGQFKSKIESWKIRNSKTRCLAISILSLFQCFISFPVDAQLICAFVFCMRKKASQFVLDIFLISSFFYINIYLSIQWVTLDTHHFFQAHNFWRKCWNQRIYMIIYLLTFYLFDEIEKISKSIMQIILQRQRQFWQKCSCNLTVYIFYLRFALGIIHGVRCDRKSPKTIVLFKSNPSFGRWS